MRAGPWERGDRACQRGPVRCGWPDLYIDHIVLCSSIVRFKTDCSRGEPSP